MPSKPERETRATYDAIAPAYHQRWANQRDVVRRQLDYFVAGLPARNAASGSAPRVLDVGCGPGFDTALLAAAGLHAVGADLSRGMLRVGQGHYAVTLLQADMRRLPFGSTFDGCWVNASLLHLPRPAVPAALAEFRRVLRPAGLLYVALKEGTGAGWQTEPGGRRFFTYWSTDDFAIALARAGFVPEHREAIDSGTARRWLTFFARRSDDA